jgi:hypothetical protein
MVERGQFSWREPGVRAARSRRTAARAGIGGGGCATAARTLRGTA